MVWESSKMAAAPSCINADGCVMFDCLSHLWEWLDPPLQQQYDMENKTKTTPATQQPASQHVMAHHVHADQIYGQQVPVPNHMASTQTTPVQPNGVMYQHLQSQHLQSQHLQSQYQSNMNPRSPLLENRHELYGTHNKEYRHYGTNDNLNYPQSPPRENIDHNVNHELLYNVPKGYNAEVFQDYMKRNPPKDTNQIYQNHQATYRPNMNQYGGKPYLPYSNRIGPQSNTELLRRQYNEIQQMKLQQQMHYQNQAQMHQQQKFAERQLLLQQIHGIQPPSNLQNSMYSDGSYRDLDRYGSKGDFKEYSSPDIQKDVDMYAKNNEYKELEKQRQYQECQWQANQPPETERLGRQSEGSKAKSQSPPSDYNNQKNYVGVVSPMKSSDSSSPSVKSPSSDSRRSSSGFQALRSPVAQRMPSAPVTMSGILYKQGSDGLKVWRKRWFVLSEYCLFYYKSQDEEKLLGSVLLPSYKVSACTADDKVLRKFAFKLEHANMRTYVLAAPAADAAVKWVKALTMAALMQSCNIEQPSNSGRAAKTEDGDEIPGPTYANAPPKPRRSNEGYNSPSPDMYDPNYDLLKKPASHYSQGNSCRYQDTYGHESNYSRSPPQAPALHQQNTNQQQSLANQQLTMNQQSTGHQQTLGFQQITLHQKPTGHLHQQNIGQQQIPSGHQLPTSHEQSTLHQNQQSPYRRAQDTHHLSLPLNTVSDKLDEPSTSDKYRSNNQNYFDTRNNQEQIYEKKKSLNPFLQDLTPQEPQKETITEQNARQNEILKAEDVAVGKFHNDTYEERPNNITAEKNYEAKPNPKVEFEIRGKSIADYDGRINPNVEYNREVYGELTRQNRPSNSVNERLIERRTPDAYGRSPTMSSYKGKVGDYEDVYSTYEDNEYGKSLFVNSPNVLSRCPADAVSVASNQQQEYAGNYNQEKTFSGPSVLRRKKMQSSGIQAPMPRPHSADFLEYESKNAMLNRTMPAQSVCDPPRQPQRPKSSLDINSYYDPSSDRYYSEESYAEKMRQSAQYLQQGLGPRNIEIPLAKYASGLAKKQLHSPYSQTANNNYETEFGSNRTSRENTNSKYDQEALNSNWTLKEKENREFLNRSGSVMSDGSNAGFVKEISRYEANPEAFMRSASARLPSNTEKDGEKKIQQREESMKRLLEWKQRMLQSPLTRKSTPATISLARSLNHSRQSLRSDQYKPKAYGQTYNSYSSDDEEEASGTDLQKPRDMQAGRSQRVNLTCPNVMRPVPTHAPSLDNVDQKNESSDTVNNTYENVLCTVTSQIDSTREENDKVDIYHNDSIVKENVDQNDENGYETHESEAESETQMEYTDDDLDEVLLKSDIETQRDDINQVASHDSDEEAKPEVKPQTPPLRSSGEDHYLPMSPRKASIVEPPHKILLQNLSVFDQSMPQSYEDSPYVEMTLGNDEEDMQTYEIVCVNDGKIEPVYMELSNVLKEIESEKSCGIFLLDTASNFADTKEQTLKRVSKDKSLKEKFDCSDADDETSKDISLDTPFNRFSISDTFRPASYYLGGSRNIPDIQYSSDTDMLLPPPIPSTSPPCDELSDEALSKYVLDKLDKSDILQDNSILKMLTSENQKMKTVKRKTTTLMIYGSRTSIHDTLSRGEKIRNSRASLTNDRKLSEVPSNLLTNSILEHCNSSSIESDSLQSYSADQGSSRLSLESDISSKFEMAPSNLSSEVASLNESESAIDFRYPSFYKDVEMMIKRRPLSDDSIFHLAATDLPIQTEIASNIDLDRFLDNLQPTTSHHLIGSQTHLHAGQDASPYKDNMMRAAQLQPTHSRCSSTPVSHSNTSNCTKERHNSVGRYRNIDDQISGYIGSQSSCSSVGIPKSPISYYCKDYDEETLLNKNLNIDIMADKIKEFDSEKLALKTGNDTNTSSTTTGFHSRESSTEHSAPYYYSDLSSQEHINLISTSHFLKNTNLHRKLNNQRRRGPLHKKNEISHIHNPIRNNQVLLSDRAFESASPARSVSVEFLSAADKDPEIDLKNIYESTGGRISKIPESMSLISGLGCKRNSINNSNNVALSPECNAHHSSLNASASLKISNASMSSHCSENSSNTVYYDAEAEASAYENIICQGEKHWDEDSLWRDNLRRVSHRHARSMDDLDTMPEQTLRTMDPCGMNSIKRVKKNVVNKLTRNVTYVNCDIQNQVLRIRNFNNCPEEDDKDDNDLYDDNDVYVSLAENADISVKPDDGVYEQLAVESAANANTLTSKEYKYIKDRNRRRFEIDREKLRQWDLMSSGLLKDAVRGAGAGVGTGEALCSTDTHASRASNEASMTMSGTNVELVTNISSNQQTLSKKAFLGSNTSIGRNNRDANIPVRAVSPRVRWVEAKASEYGSQQINNSHQNLNTTEDSWSVRSPSRSQQPVRAVSPRVRRNTEHDDMRQGESVEVPTAGELLGRTHEELVLLLIQLRRRHAATHRAIEQCCAQICSIEDCLGSLKAMEREESVHRLETLKMQLMDLESQYEKSKPLVTLVDNMVKLGSLYNRPGSTVERLERNQRLRQKVLAEHALEQQRWIESAGAGRPLETEAARARVSELWALERELADEAALLHGLRTDRETIESLLTGVRGRLDKPRADLGMSPCAGAGTGAPESPDDAPISLEPLGPPNASADGLEAELARVHAMLAHNSKKLEQTVADNGRLERELDALRRALHARRAAPHPPHSAHPARPTAAVLEDEVSRVQQLVGALQRQRQELSRAVRLLTRQSHALQDTHLALPEKRRQISSWQETNLDTGHTTECDLDVYHSGAGAGGVQAPLYVDTRQMAANDVTSPSPLPGQHTAFGNLTNVEKQEIKTVRIVKRESERRQRDRDRSLQPMADWPAANVGHHITNIDQYLEDELVQPVNHARAHSVPRSEFSQLEDYYAPQEPPTYSRLSDKSAELSPKFPSSPSLSTCDYSRGMSSLATNYNRSYDRSYDRTMSLSTHYLSSPADSTNTLTNDPLSKTSSVISLNRSNMELSPIFKSEAAKQIITEMSPSARSAHRRAVPKEKRRHYTAPHHLSAKTLSEMPKDAYGGDRARRSLDDADLERVLRGAPAPDVVPASVPAPARCPDIDQLLAAPQKILIPERYIPEKPPELSPEEQQKRQEKVESIKKMLSSGSADPNSKSPDGEERRQRAHLLQMNQILAQQVTEMSKIIAVKALEELPQSETNEVLDDRSPDVELPIYQQRHNFFT